MRRKVMEEARQGSGVVDGDGMKVGEMGDDFTGLRAADPRGMDADAGTEQLAAQTQIPKPHSYLTSPFTQLFPSHANSPTTPNILHLTVILLDQFVLHHTT
jgi:hypothetical protein